MKQKIPSPTIKTRLEQNRLAELLDVAAEVFLAEGFSAASTNEIARRANSSKETFYSRFPTKESLFVAVIERRMKSVLEDVTTSLPREAPMEDTLREFGSRLLRTVLTEKQTKLIRLISMESSRFPALGELFFELGPKRGQAFLADYLAVQVQQHRLRDGDTVRMAEHYKAFLAAYEQKP